MASKKSESSKSVKTKANKKASGTVEFTYEFDRAQLNGNWPTKEDVSRGKPVGESEAATKLCEGNATFAGFIAQCKGHGTPRPVKVSLVPREIGKVENNRGFPDQLPFAAILGCVDARAPVELLFSQGFDDLYITRIAGNTLGPDCSGSLHYALHSFAALKPNPPAIVDPKKKPLRLIVSLGHSDCGAVTAAVETFAGFKKKIEGRVDLPDKYKPLDLPGLEGHFLPDGSVTGLLTRIQYPAVAVALEALPIEPFGTGLGSTDLYSAALVDLAIYLNAAWSAHQVVALVQQYEYDKDEYAVGVRYGVFDPRDCRVRSGSESYGTTKDSYGPNDGVWKRFGITAEDGKQGGGIDCLLAPPADLNGLEILAKEIAAQVVEQLNQELGIHLLREHFNLTSDATTQA